MHAWSRRHAWSTCLLTLPCASCSPTPSCTHTAAPLPQPVSQVHAMRMQVRATSPCFHTNCCLALPSPLPCLATPLAIPSHTPLPLTRPQSESLVLVGDPQQLPPTVRSGPAGRLGLGVPLFQRLQAQGHRPWLLDTQYRWGQGEGVGGGEAHVHAGRSGAGRRAGRGVVRAACVMMCALRAWGEGRCMCVLGGAKQAGGRVCVPCVGPA